MNMSRFFFFEKAGKFICDSIVVAPFINRNILFFGPFGIVNNCCLFSTSLLKSYSLSKGKNTTNLLYLISDKEACATKFLSFSTLSESSFLPPPRDYTPPRLRMRGLPFNANNEDILNFFEGYELYKKENESPLDSTNTWNGGDTFFLSPVEIVRGRDGKPTGTAYIYFSTEAEARRARHNLNRRYIKDRYIELYVDYLSNEYTIRTEKLIESLNRDRYVGDNR